MKEGFSQMPEEEIGDKKEKQEKKSTESGMPPFVQQLKEEEKPKSWLKEKFDKWREQM